MEAELYREMMEEKGVHVTERINNNLETFGKESQKSALGDLFGQVMTKIKDQRQLITTDSNNRFERRRGGEVEDLSLLQGVKCFLP